MSTENKGTPLLPEKNGKNETIFLNRLSNLIEQHCNNPSFGVQQLAQQIQLSRVQLNRKTMELTGQSAGKLITQYRMQMAKQMLRDSQATIKEIAWQCGYLRQGNFCRSFHLMFRHNPTDYRKKFTTARRKETSGWVVPLSEDDYTSLYELSCEQPWLRKLLQEVISHISSNVLSVQQLCAATYMSPVSLNRKIKELFLISTQRFIRDIRLQYACELISTGYGSMAEIAYQCGFYDPAHMSRCFKKSIGCQPTAFASTPSSLTIEWLKNKLLNHNDK
ncbi:MAG TPA: AraC family transcriptional regulator [Flavipsychrobacter sp.]